MINLKHLRVFVEVHDREGITTAADVVHLSQPAITQAISSLERAFETLLFTRKGRKMFPTQAGRALRSRCTPAFQFLESISLRAKPIIHSHRVRQLTSRQLRSLVAVAKHRSYLEAARSIDVSQPSLFRAAKDLEAQCNSPLYRKTERGVELTAAGRVLFQAANLAFLEIEQVYEDIEEIEGRNRGVLRIGSLPLSLGTVLPKSLHQLRHRYPDIRVSIIDNPFEELLEALRFGELDLMIGALRNPVPASDVTQETLFNDRLGVFCGPNHPALGASLGTMHELVKFPWIVARGTTPTRLHFDRVFASLPPTINGPAVETNSMAAARHLLQDNVSCALLSMSQAAQYEAMGEIRKLPVSVGDTPREIGVVTRSNWRPTAIHTAFLDELRNTLVNQY